MHHFVAPFPYILADALLAEVFLMHYGKPKRVTRRTISSGSCLYQLDKVSAVVKGEIYLRALSETHTYIRLLTVDENPDMLLLYLSYLKDLHSGIDTLLSEVPSINSIKRSESTREAFSEGAARYAPPAKPTSAISKLTFAEDKHAVEELREHPEQREQIHGRWSRAVQRNKQRTLSAKSMGATWRRLVQKAKEQKE